MRKTGRLHIRVSPELAEAIKGYVARHNTTLSAVVEDHLSSLLEQEPVKRLQSVGFERQK